jgi:hypothetical protein
VPLCNERSVKPGQVDAAWCRRCFAGRGERPAPLLCCAPHAAQLAREAGFIRQELASQIGETRTELMRAINRLTF